MAKILKFEKDAKQKLLDGIEVVYRAVSATLGPRGNNVAIDRKWGAPTVVHDGVTVAKEIDLEDPFENMGAQLIKEAAQKTNDSSGDGTTGATILTYAIVTEALKNIAAGNNAMMLRRGINKAVEVVTAELQKMAKEVKTKEEMTQIATISAQDETIGMLIGNTIEKMGKEAVITVEESGNTTITVDYKEGMEFDRGYLSSYFVTDAEKNDATVKNPYILVTDMTIASMPDFQEFLINQFAQVEKDGNGLVIIAENVMGEPLATLVVNKIRKSVDALAIQAPAFGDKRKDILEDIAILTGGKFISADLGMKLGDVTLADLGRASRVTSTKDNTMIVDGRGNAKALKERVKSIEAQIAKTESEFEREKLQERLAKLTSGIAVINVGASSEIEMKEKKERCIDAIGATKAAIQEGVVPGGETALLRAKFALEGTLAESDMTQEEMIGFKTVMQAIEQPFIRLMENSGYNAGEMMAELKRTKAPFGVDVIDGEMKDLIKAGVIDPVKVTRSALENAASVGIMIMSTDVLITDAPEKAKETLSQGDLPI